MRATGTAYRAIGMALVLGVRCVRCTLRPSFTPIAVPATVLLATLAGFPLEPPLAAQSAISADGVVESRSGGFKFPDGSVQLAAAAPFGECPTMDPADEMVWVGGICIDKYEASVWDAPVGGNEITGPIPCSPNGQDCSNIWARSVAGAQPRVSITWFQAQQALANSGKRMPTNAEWQMTVRGTPDGVFCNVDSNGPVPTGSLSRCSSDWGAFDLVGNVWEWVADWVSVSTGCPGWGSFSDDLMCVSGAATTTQGPGALIRGGDHFGGTSAGPLAIEGFGRPSDPNPRIGFRGAR